MRVFALGYCNTGSSAIVHLLKEFDGCQSGFDNNYEHIVFYTPHGLFDLENVLLNNNTIHRSDAAINDFYQAMKRLNDFDFGWCGGYGKRYGDKFMSIVNDFIQSLIEHSHPGNWDNDYHYRKQKFRIKSIAAYFVRRFILGKKVAFPNGYTFDKSKSDGVINYCFVTPDEFYKKAKKFVDSYFELIGYNPQKVMITDQSLQPQHLIHFLNYANPDDKYIIVRRDVRDLYIQSKYVWSKYDNSTVFPKDADSFCSFYSRFLATEKIIDDPRILRIQFEDLVYNYDSSLRKIYDFIGGGGVLGNHTHEKQFFNPNQSIKNTQTFLISKEWKKEVEPIENKMKQLLYDFPFCISTSVDEITDPNPDTSK